MFSKSCQYAIQAVIYIACNGDGHKAIRLKEIAQAQDLPTHFLGKIMQDLVKKKILTSTKGPNGGFRLARNAEDIVLMDVYDIVDGIETFDNCVIGFGTCSDVCPCPLHSKYEGIKADFMDFLSSKSFGEICTEIESGISYSRFLST